MTPQPTRKFFRDILSFLVLIFLAPAYSSAQGPEGPMTPPPGVIIQQSPPSQLKVKVILVNTPVVVRDNKGEMIHDLAAKDFHVTDNGVLQQITHFDLGGDPISMVLLVETSSRVAALLPELRKTGILITQTVMGPTGEAAVVTFHDSIDKLQDFTSRDDVIEHAISSVPEGTSGTRLYDAMAVGVEMLTGRPQGTAATPGTRRVLMILAEATDIGSEIKLGEVLRRAQLANVTIYSVGLSTTRSELQAKHPPETQSPMTPPGTFGHPPFPGTPQTPDNDAAMQGVDITALAVWAVQHAENIVKKHALEAAAAATGGAHFATFKDRSIEKAIDEVGAELHAEYTLSYSPTDAGNPGYHEISITVDRQNLNVRARPGYYLP